MLHLGQCRSSCYGRKVVLVEKTTRGQSTRKSWFLFRSGRLTASDIKGVAKSNPAMPSPSLIKKICNPQLHSISTYQQQGNHITLRMKKS